MKVPIGVFGMAIGVGAYPTSAAWSQPAAFLRPMACWPTRCG